MQKINEDLENSQRIGNKMHPTCMEQCIIEIVYGYMGSIEIFSEYVCDECMEHA